MIPVKRHEPRILSPASTRIKHYYKLTVLVKWKQLHTVWRVFQHFLYGNLYISLSIFSLWIPSITWDCLLLWLPWFPYITIKQATKIPIIASLKMTSPSFSLLKNWPICSWKSLAFRPFSHNQEVLQNQCKLQTRKWVWGVSGLNSHFEGFRGRVVAWSTTVRRTRDQMDHWSAALAFWCAHLLKENNIDDIVMH